MSAIERLQQEAVQRYIKNLQYFEQNHPKVFKKLTLLDTAINSGQYIEKYSLEYKDEGYFDVKDISSGNFLYGENAIEYSKKLANNIDKSKEKNVIEGFYRHHFIKEMVDKVRKQKAYESVESCVLPLVEFVYQHTQNKEYMRHIKKMIFFGTGLGYHLSLINKAIKQPAIFLIIEDDLELFRLSLFTTDYSMMEEKNNDIFFSIMDDDFYFRKVFDDFFDMGYLYNNYIKYTMFTDNYRDKFNKLQTFIVGQSHLGYTYDRLLQKYILSLKPVKEDYRFLNISNPFKNNMLKDKPILFLAAGPSLEKNMQWLKKNHKNFIVISVFMILPILAKNGITPDIIIHIDEQEHPIRRVLSQIDLTTYATNSLFVFAPGIDIDWFKSYNIKERTFLIEDRTNYKIDHGFFQFSSVGETGYALSLLFGTDEIYILGLDLAFDKESGKSHSDGHGTHMSLNQQSKNVSLRETFLTVKGNFRDEVITNPLFQESILDVKEIALNYKQEYQKVYNLSDGAFLEGMIPLKVNDIQLTTKANKENIIDLLNDILYKYSSTISSDELQLFKVRYDNIIKKERELKKYLKQNSKNFEELLNSFIQLAIKLTVNKDMSISQMEQILATYLQYSGIYISEFCNTAGLGYDKKSAHKFRKTIVEQFERIITPYKEAIEEIL